MNAVAYCHPFVPPEWIAAHGLRPCWLPCRAGDEPAVWVRRGVCPVAAVAVGRFCRRVAGRSGSADHHLRSNPLRCRPAAASGHAPRLPAARAEDLANRGGAGLLSPGTQPPGQVPCRLRRHLAQRRRPFPDDAPIRSGESIAPQRRGEMSASAFAQAIAAVRGHLLWRALPTLEGGLKHNRESCRIGRIFPWRSSAGRCRRAITNC